MKKIQLAVAAILAAGVMTVGCSKSEHDDTTPVVNGADSTAALVIRYVDIDSVNAKYELSKELSAEVQTAYNNYQAFATQKQGELQRMAQTMQQKYQNNAYASQAQFEQDERQFAQAQQNAQNQVAQREQSFAEYHDSQLVRVNDSINVFLKDLCEKNHIDAVLPKAVGLYFNPALDITDAVIDGLNARYAKYKAPAAATEVAKDDKTPKK